MKRPREQVFEALTDFERVVTAAAAAAKAEVGAERVPDRPRTGLGSAVRLKIDLPGMGEVLSEVTEWDPPRKAARLFHIKDLPTTLTMRLGESAEGTKLTLSIEMKPESMMFKMMLPVLAKRIRAEKDKALAQLKSRLDSA